MRIALVHDYLNQLGGGERVLRELMEMFPSAPVFTLLYDKKKTRGIFEGRVTATSFLDFQFARNHHRLFIPFMPLAAKSINLKDKFDLIISDSAGFGKGIRYNSKTTKHISYCHTPLRYAWETETYFDNQFKNRVLKILGAPAFAYVRHFDYLSGQRPDKIIANSDYIAQKIRSYYGRPSSVIYPPIDTDKFYFDPSNESQDYYLALGRLMGYKRFDLIISAFNKLGLPLKIVGAGPKEKELKKSAKNNIQFISYIDSDEEVRKIYSSARAFIMANEEDFGMVMAEAQSCGTPVIAYGAGGAKEIVKKGTTGVFFNYQNTESLIKAVKKFEKLEFNRHLISQTAQRFSKENFKKAIQEEVSLHRKQNELGYTQKKAI